MEKFLPAVLLASTFMIGHGHAMEDIETQGGVLSRIASMVNIDNFETGDVYKDMYQQCPEIMKEMETEHPELFEVYTNYWGETEKYFKYQKNDVKQKVLNSIESVYLKVGNILRPQVKSINQAIVSEEQEREIIAQPKSLEELFAQHEQQTAKFAEQSYSAVTQNVLWGFQELLETLQQDIEELDVAVVEEVDDGSEEG